MVVRIMGFRDSRLGKIVSVFSDFGRSLFNWLGSVDVDDLTVAEAVRNVNRKGNGTIDNKVLEAMTVAADLNAREANDIFNRVDTVGPVFSAADGSIVDKDKDEDPTVALNRVLKDATMEYVEGNPVELQAVEPQKLGKGGREREKIR